MINPVIDSGIAHNDYVQATADIKSLRREDMASIVAWLDAKIAVIQADMISCAAAKLSENQARISALLELRGDITRPQHQHRIDVRNVLHKNDI